MGSSYLKGQDRDITQRRAVYELQTGSPSMLAQWTSGNVYY
jgi:hypothetical protein